MNVTAARVHDYDKPLVVEEAPLRESTADDVLVRLAFAGINPVDRYNAQGRLNSDGPLPRTIGSEASGWVDGSPVVVTGAGIGVNSDGTYATAMVAPKRAVTPIDGDIDMKKAACLGVAGLTAWKVVHDTAHVNSDDRVLVLGAGGGVGLPIVSIASRIGAEVWGQVGHEEKAHAVSEAGAKNVVVVDATALAGAVQDLKPTVVIDPLGGAFTSAVLNTMETHGRVVIYGTSAGADAYLNLQALYRSGLKILGYAGLQLTEDERRHGVEQSIQALSDGRLDIFIEKTLPLSQVNDAFEELRNREVTGKIVLDLSN